MFSAQQHGATLRGIGAFKRGTQSPARRKTGEENLNCRGACCERRKKRDGSARLAETEAAKEAVSMYVTNPESAPVLPVRDRLVIDGVEVTRDMMVAGSEVIGTHRLEGWIVSDLRAAAEIYAAMCRAKSPQ